MIFKSCQIQYFHRLSGLRNTEQKAQQSIKDNELLAQFKAVEELDSKDKSTIKRYY